MSGAKFTDEFKRDAVAQVVDRGYPVREVAERLGVSTKSIYTWQKQKQFSRPAKVIQEVDAQADEIRRLKRDLLRVTEERDILKKAFAIKPIVTASGQIDATMRLGADATFTNSDDISATVLGQPLAFSTTQDTALRGFAGIDLAQAMNNGAKLNLSVEAGYGSNSAVTLHGTAGLVWAF